MVGQKGEEVRGSQSSVGGEAGVGSLSSGVGVAAGQGGGT